MGGSDRGAPFFATLTHATQASLHTDAWSPVPHSLPSDPRKIHAAAFLQNISISWRNPP